MIDELTEIQNRFHSIVLLIGDGFNKRFKLLENHMSLNMNRDDVMDVQTESDMTDYLALALESAFSVSEMYREYVAEKQYLEFTNKFSKKNVGSVCAYFEADANQQQTTQATTQKTQTTQTQNAQKPQPTQQQNNGGGTDAKPKVVDNSQNNNGNNNNQQQTGNNNQNANQNDSNSKKLDKTYTDGVCGELSRLIKDLISKMRKALSSGGKRNKEMLDAGKDEMINRSYNNVQVTDMLPFSMDDVIAQVGDIMNVVRALTPNEVKTMNKEAIEDKLLAKT